MLDWFRQSTAMPRHPLSIVLIALVCLLCSNKNAEASTDAKEEKPKATGDLQDSLQSSETHEPVTPVSNYEQIILSHSNRKEIHPSTLEAKSTVLDTSNDGLWCIVKPSTDAYQLQRNIDFVCTESTYAVKCDATRPGGDCYTPGNKVSEASYDMNLYYQNQLRSPSACVFNDSGLVVSHDPSWGPYHYPTN